MAVSTVTYKFVWAIKEAAQLSVLVRIAAHSTASLDSTVVFELEASAMRSIASPSLSQQSGCTVFSDLVSTIHLCHRAYVHQEVFISLVNFVSCYTDLYPGYSYSIQRSGP